MAPATLGPTARTTARRLRERGSNDRELIDKILDEGLICHVGFVDDGSVFVQPTAYGRVGDALYLHGAVGNRMLRLLGSGAECCVTVTLLDGLVLARSAFHHSMNYRSVVLLGSCRAVEDEDEKLAASLAIVERLVPGRVADVRPPTPAELRATLVVEFPIVEGSAKVRAGGPKEEPEDLALAVWAGQLPVVQATLGPIPEPDLVVGVEVPGYVSEYERPRRA